MSKLDEIKKKLDDLKEILEKSNYGPKKMKLYDSVNSIERKKTRMGDELKDIGPNKAVRQFTTVGSSVQAAYEKAEAKRQKAKTEESTRSMKDMSPEELEEINARLNKDELDEKIKAKLSQEMNRRNFGEADATRHIIDRDRGDTEPLKHSESEKIEYHKNGQWDIKKDEHGPKKIRFNAMRPQDPTDSFEGREEKRAARKAAAAEREKYKSPARTKKDMSPEELEEITTRLNKNNAPHAPESAEDSAHDVIEEHGDLRRELLDLTDEQKKTMLEHIRKYKRHGNDWLRSQQNRKIGEES